MQPSLEDVVLGLVTGFPKVHLHNKVLAAENGDGYWTDPNTGSSLNGLLDPQFSARARARQSKLLFRDLHQAYGVDETIGEHEIAVICHVDV